MNERSDKELLFEYATHGVEKAFEILVSRHLGLVYHAALRQTQNSDVAKDVTQVVFTLLARKIGQAASGASLVGWLLKTTRFVSSTALRTDLRRRRRDEEAFRLNILNTSSSNTADVMEITFPILDQSLAELHVADRDALSMRYLEGKTFAGSCPIAENHRRNRS